MLFTDLVVFLRICYKLFSAYYCRAARSILSLPTVFRVRSPEHAQMLCEWYGDRCKAFVFFMRSAELYLKSDITGKIESLPGRSVYIKKAHSKGIKLPLNNMCAVATDVERSSSQSNCRLVELNPFDVSIMKYINKPDKALECRGVPLTRYKSGQLKIIRPSKGA